MTLPFRYSTPISISSTAIPHLAVPGLITSTETGIEMIELIPTGWDARLECVACRVSEYAYVPEGERPDLESFGHKGCVGVVVNMTRQFIKSDPDYVSPYACNGCDECNDV